MENLGSRFPKGENQWLLFLWVWMPLHSTRYSAVLWGGGATSVISPSEMTTLGSKEHLWWQPQVMGVWASPAVIFSYLTGLWLTSASALVQCSRRLLSESGVFGPRILGSAWTCCCCTARPSGKFHHPSAVSRVSSHDSRLLQETLGHLEAERRRESLGVQQSLTLSLGPWCPWQYWNMWNPQAKASEKNVQSSLLSYCPF